MIFISDSFQIKIIMVQVADPNYWEWALILFLLIATYSRIPISLVCGLPSFLRFRAMQEPWVCLSLVHIVIVIHIEQKQSNRHKIRNKGFDSSTYKIEKTEETVTLLKPNY